MVGMACACSSVLFCSMGEGLGCDLIFWSYRGVGTNCTSII